MAKAEWGSKRTCPKCATRFYDLGNEEPVTCISCGNTWIPEPVLKSKQPLPYEEMKPDTAAKGDADLDTDLDLDVEDEEPSPDDEVDLGTDDDLGVDTGETNQDV